jgi:hypothetical protein
MYINSHEIIFCDYYIQMSVLTICPNIDTNLQHKDVMLVNPSNFTVRRWVSTSYSNNNATFSMPPPSTDVFIDRCFVMAVPMTITYTGTTTGSALLQAGYDSLRAYPISSVTNNAQLTLNNVTFSFQTSDFVPYLARFWKQQRMSGFPSMLDNYQNYVDGVGSVNNSLGTIGNSVKEVEPRGAYPMIVVNGATSSTITTTVYEPIFLPVLHHNTGDGLGFSGIKTIDLVINYANNLSRIVSHATSLATLSNVSVALGQPTIDMLYSSPPMNMPKQLLTYVADDLTRFITPVGQALAPNASANMTSTNIQLNCVPKWLLIFVREANQNLTYASTDTALNISALSINFDNLSGQLSSATEFDLWRLSVANGFQGTWTDYHGVTANPSTGAQIGTAGSFLKLYFGKDITLNEGSYVGKVGAFNLQLNLTVTNKNQSTTIQAPQLYMLIGSHQKIEISPDGFIKQTLGIVPRATDDYIPFGEANEFYGGSFMDWIYKLGRFIKSNKLISRVAKAIPHPIAQVVGDVADKVGYGGYGGYGGAVASRGDLLKRLQNV